MILDSLHSYSFELGSYESWFTGIHLITSDGHLPFIDVEKYQGALCYEKNHVSFALLCIPHSCYGGVSSLLHGALSAYSALNGGLCLCVWGFHSPAYLEGRKKMAKVRKNCDHALSLSFF